MSGPVINTENLKKKFSRMGARLEIHRPEARKLDRVFRDRNTGKWIEWRKANPFSVNVRTDEFGEHFTMSIADNSMVPEGKSSTEPTVDLKSISILDVQPKDRHLVMQVVLGEGKDMQVDTMLMGHDERHWFIARTGGNTVAEARDDLKPPEVLEREKRAKVKRSKRNKRKNAAFIRQGEWFFLPEPDFDPGKMPVISHNEPLRRGAGKPHMAEEACRVGGETVRVHPIYARNGMSMNAYNKLINSKDFENKRKYSWQTLTRGARVYVRGKIRHPDHKTLKLRGWHQVVPNTEQRRVGGRLQTVAFLD